MKTFIISLILSMSLISSSFAYNYYEAGRAEFKKGNYSKANRFFQDELKENPENINCRYIYAQSFVGMNDLVNAQKEYEKVIEQSPSSEIARLSSIAMSKIHGYYTEKTNISSKNSYGSSIADNYIQNTLYTGKIVRWNISAMPVKVYIQPSDYAQAVKLALDYWPRVSEPKTLSYSIVNSSKDANISVSFVSEIGKANDKSYLAGLATPVIKGYMLESCSIKLRITDEKNNPVSQEEIFSIALHEFGHAFGIWGHSPKESDIMYDSDSANSNNSIQALTQRDINTFRILYRLDPDISNFTEGQSPVVNSAKNSTILGNTDQRISKKYQEAVDYIKKFPNNAVGWSNLGDIYYEAKQYQEAIICYQKTLELDNSIDEAKSNLALSYEKTGDLSKASDQFSGLVRQNPKNADYAHNYALFLIKNKKYSEASDVINNLIKANPDAASNKNIQSLINYLKNPG